MDFHELFLTQHARTHTAEVGRPDLSVQDTVLRDVTDEQMRLRPRPGNQRRPLAGRRTAIGTRPAAMATA